MRENHISLVSSCGAEPPLHCNNVTQLPTSTPHHLLHPPNPKRYRRRLQLTLKRKSKRHKKLGLVYLLPCNTLCVFNVEDYQLLHKLYTTFPEKEVFPYLRKACYAAKSLSRFKTRGLKNIFTYNVIKKLSLF